MSDLFFNNKKNQLQFTNLLIGIHDLNCNCNNPGFHSLKIITQQIGPELNPTDKLTIKKCLGDTPTTQEDDVGFTAGDLEELFGEGDGDEDDNR